MSDTEKKAIKEAYAALGRERDLAVSAAIQLANLAATSNNLAHIAFNAMVDGCGRSGGERES